MVKLYGTRPTRPHTKTTALILPALLPPVTVDMTGQATVEVTIDVDANLVGVPFYIQADQGDDGRVMSNDVPLYFTHTEPQTIQATVKPSWQSPTFPWALLGDMVWKLHVLSTKQLIVIKKTRLEIYGLTKSLSRYYANVIDVDFLRAMMVPARHSGETDRIAYVIKIIFETPGYGAFRFRYDTPYDVSHFGPSGGGGNFDLRTWVRPNLVWNAYDQAGIFQIGLGYPPCEINVEVHAAIRIYHQNEPDRCRTLQQPLLRGERVHRLDWE